MLILFIILLLIFIVLNYLDAKTTYFVTSRVGHKSERNPLGRFLIKKFGVLKGIVILKIFIIVILPMIVWAYTESPIKINIIMFILNVFYIFVVINNKKVCKSLNKDYKF